MIAASCGLPVLDALSGRGFFEKPGRVRQFALENLTRIDL